MKTITDNHSSSFLLSSTPAPMSFISFQIVYQYEAEKKFIKSFNLIAEGKILKKIYLKEMVPYDEKINTESLIIDELLKAIDTPSNDSTEKSRKKTVKYRTDYDARIKAANSLFEEMGL